MWYLDLYIPRNSKNTINKKAKKLVNNSCTTTNVLTVEDDVLDICGFKANKNHNILIDRECNEKLKLNKNISLQKCDKKCDKNSYGSSLNGGGHRKEFKAMLKAIKKHNKYFNRSSTNRIGNDRNEEFENFSEPCRKSNVKFAKASDIAIKKCNKTSRIPRELSPNKTNAGFNPIMKTCEIAHYFEGNNKNQHFPATRINKPPEPSKCKFCSTSNLTNTHCLNPYNTQLNRITDPGIIQFPDPFKYELFSCGKLKNTQRSNPCKTTSNKKENPEIKFPEPFKYELFSSSNLRNTRCSNSTKTDNNKYFGCNYCRRDSSSYINLPQSNRLLSISEEEDFISFKDCTAAIPDKLKKKITSKKDQNKGFLGDGSYEEIKNKAKNAINSFTDTGVCEVQYKDKSKSRVTFKDVGKAVETYHSSCDVIHSDVEIKRALGDSFVKSSEEHLSRKSSRYSTASGGSSNLSSFQESSSKSNDLLTKSQVNSFYTEIEGSKSNLHCNIFWTNNPTVSTSETSTLKYPEREKQMSKRTGFTLDESSHVPKNKLCSNKYCSNEPTSLKTETQTSKGRFGSQSCPTNLSSSALKKPSSQNFEDSISNVILFSIPACVCSTVQCKSSITSQANPCGPESEKNIERIVPVVLIDPPPLYVSK